MCPLHQWHFFLLWTSFFCFTLVHAPLFGFIMKERDSHSPPLYLRLWHHPVKRKGYSLADYHRRRAQIFSFPTATIPREEGDLCACRLIPKLNDQTIPYDYNLVSSWFDSLAMPCARILVLLLHNKYYPRVSLAPTLASDGAVRCSKRKSNKCMKYDGIYDAT